MFYKNARRPYKGETWKILCSEDKKNWRIHSEYSHACFRDEALKKLTKEAP